MVDLAPGIVRGPNAFFASDANLYPPGSLCPCCPADQVGDDKAFAPAPKVAAAVQPKKEQPGVGNFDASKFINRNAADVIAGLDGVDPVYLGVIERSERVAKGRKTVLDAIKERR